MLVYQRVHVSSQFLLAPDASPSGNHQKNKTTFYVSISKILILVPSFPPFPFPFPFSFTPDSEYHHSWWYHDMIYLYNYNIYISIYSWYTSYYTSYYRYHGEPQFGLVPCWIPVNPPGESPIAPAGRAQWSEGDLSPKPAAGAPGDVRRLRRPNRSRDL